MTVVIDGYPGAAVNYSPDGQQGPEGVWTAEELAGLVPGAVGGAAVDGVGVEGNGEQTFNSDLT